MENLVSHLLYRFVLLCALGLVALPALAQQDQQAQQQQQQQQQQQGMPLAVDGDMWMKSSHEVRRAFLLGASSMVAMEIAYAQKKGSPAPPAGTMAHQALQGMSLDDVSSRITRWYEANPTRRKMPVMGVVWVDMVKPK